MAWLKDSPAEAVGVNFGNDLASSLAAELESNSCPICFELMKPPTRSPMILSPCGHTFCSKCLAVHTCGNTKKTTCPYCRQKIASQTLNLSLQKLIDNLSALQSRPSRKSSPSREKDRFSHKLAQAETRCNILRRELVETGEARKDLEVALKQVDDRLDELHTRENDLSDMIHAIQVTHQGVQQELRDTESSRSTIERTREETTAKMNLIEATLLALEKDCQKFKLLSFS